MKEKFSARIDITRFVLIIGVVFIHSYGSEVGFKGGVTGVTELGSFAQIIQEYISQLVARISVPLFYLLSGYLFFYQTELSRKVYIGKLRTRINTLLIPYLFWNLFVLLLYYVLQTIPHTTTYFSGANKPVALFNLWDYLNAIVGITRLPIAGQFWFIRDLIILVIFTPLIFWMLKRFHYFFLAPLFLIWFFNLWPLDLPAIIAVFFFCLGAILSMQKYNIFLFDPYGAYLTGIYFGLTLIDLFTKGTTANFQIHNIGILFGLTSTLYLTRFLVASKFLQEKMLSVAQSSFFIFAAHEPLLTIVRKLSYKIFQPSTDIEISSLYFANPTVVIVICIASFYFLRIIIPRPLNIITGRRLNNKTGKFANLVNAREV